MIVVIEGPDGAGKTTLAEELSGRLNMPIFQSPDTPLRGQSVEASQAQDRATMNLLQATSPNVIFDRFFPSETVYGNVFGRDYDAAATMELALDLAMLPHVMVIITHTKGGDANKRLILSRIDSEVSTDTVVKLSKEYDEYVDACMADLNVVHVDSQLTTREVVEKVMLAIVRQRPKKADHVFMGMAHLAAERSTCLSRRTGAVLVSSDGHVIATGQNGVARKCDHPTRCPRLHTSSSGQNLDVCGDVHAEENCIAQAALRGAQTRDSVMYTINSPCNRCARMMVNAGVVEVIYEKVYGDVTGLEVLDRSNIVIRQMEA